VALIRPETSVRRVASWLSIGTALLIVYGSLFPFEFVRDAGDLGTVALRIAFRATTRGDIVANLLLYAPFGFAVTFVSAARRGWLTAVALALAAGTSLSFGIEVLQAYEPARVSSLTDVALNSAGTLGGAAVALLYTQYFASRALVATPHTRVELLPCVVIALWLGNRLAPFVPTLDWQKFKDALKPLVMSPQIVALDVFAYAVGWLIVGSALGCLRRDSRLVLAVLAGIVIGGEVVLVGRQVSASELLALALCLPISLWSGRFALRTRTLLLFWLAALVVTLRGLEPFTLSPWPQPFSWVPFRSSINGDWEIGYSVLFDKAFWYASLIWLLLRNGATSLGAGLVVAGLLGGIEVVQIWLPGRSAEITDPLLAILLSIGSRMLAARSSRAARTASDLRDGAQVAEPRRAD
jgi:VanZ family protein